MHLIIFRENVMHIIKYRQKAMHAIKFRQNPVHVKYNFFKRVGFSNKLKLFTPNR